jgi:copper(I)-binding protein
MREFIRRTALVASAALLMSASAPSSAHDYTVGSVHVGHPWARETPPGASIGAGYLEISNAGPKADVLVSISSPIAERVEIHQTRVENGVARMMPLGRLAVPPGAKIVASPGGIHLMFIELKTPLKAGDRVPATLTFARAGRLKVEFHVSSEPPAADEHAGHR